MKELVYLGIDVGGTKIAAGAVSFPSGTVLHEAVRPTRVERGPQAVLNTIREVASEVLQMAEKHRHRILEIGVGLCELVGPSGEVLSHNLLLFDNSELHRKLELVGRRIHVEADVRAAARAEAMLGAGKGLEHFVYVTIGTGISSCLVLRGEPYAGSRGLTGTLPGMDITRPDALLESAASGPALCRRYAEATGLYAKGAEQVLSAAEKEPEAAEIVRSAGASAGLGVAWLVNVLDPAAVVIGGGLGLAGGLYWETLCSTARQGIWSEHHRSLAIVHATTGARAGFIGAAAFAWANHSRASDR